MGSCSTSESSDDIITLVCLRFIMNALCTHVYVSDTHNPLTVGFHRLALPGTRGTRNVSILTTKSRTLAVSRTVVEMHVCRSHISASFGPSPRMRR